MSIIDSPEFNAWLDAEFGIDRAAEPGSIGCTECGSSPELYPFIGAYCVLCLAVRYGEFLKAQDIALWLSDHAWIWQPGNINDKASAICQIGLERRRIYADEEDEEFRARWRAEDARRAAKSAHGRSVS